MIKLVCPECQRQNEPERIYCHDCGARLDRSALAKVAPKGEDPKETHRRLHKMFDPGRIKMRLLFFKLSKVILGAAALAGLIEMVLPPRELPERVKNIELQQINLDLENAVTNQSAAPLQYTDGQVNDYLVNVVRNKRAVLSKVLQFERAFVKFEEGVCAITAERSLLGFSVYHSISYQAALKNGTLSISTNGGSIGRMPIHAMIMKYGDILFTDLWDVLERDRKLVSKMDAIQFHPKTVILSARSAAAAPVEPPPPTPTPAPDA